MDSNKLTGISIWNRVQILTEEYRSLYAMLTFRLGAIDQRLPLAAGALTAILVSTPSLPQYQRVILLWLVPVACVWLHRIVLLHIQSKEDVLRRIAEIECQVNRLASSDLMVFQSQHPNRGRVVGGRSGFGTVLGVLTVCLLAILISTGFMAGEFASDLGLAGYFLYGIAASGELIHSTCRMSKYRYKKPLPSGAE